MSFQVIQLGKYFCQFFLKFLKANRNSLRLPSPMDMHTNQDSSNISGKPPECSPMSCRSLISKFHIFFSSFEADIDSYAEQRTLSDTNAFIFCNVLIPLLAEQHDILRTSFLGGLNLKNSRICMFKIYIYIYIYIIYTYIFEQQPCFGSSLKHEALRFSAHFQP